MKYLERLNRRIVSGNAIIVIAATMALELSSLSARLGELTAAAATDPNGTAIRPFKVHVPEETLVDLKRRLKATRWPDDETVPDQSQGVPSATMKEVVRYWQTGYDWRKA